MTLSMALVVRWLHVVSAITWVGGMLFIALVLVPVTRRLEDRTLAARLIRDVGRRFRTIGWIAITVLVVTGLLNLWYYPFFLYSPKFHLKLTVVLVAIALAVIHDFVLGPRAGRPGADPVLRVQASWVARINVLVVLVVVFLGLGLFT